MKQGENVESAASTCLKNILIFLKKKEKYENQLVALATGSLHLVAPCASPETKLNSRLERRG